MLLQYMNTILISDSLVIHQSVGGRSEVRGKVLQNLGNHEDEPKADIQVDTTTFLKPNMSENTE